MFAMQSALRAIIRVPSSVWLPDLNLYYTGNNVSTVCVALLKWNLVANDISMLDGQFSLPTPSTGRLLCFKGETFFVW